MNLSPETHTRAHTHTVQRSPELSVTVVQPWARDSSLYGVKYCWVSLMSATMLKSVLVTVTANMVSRCPSRLTVVPLCCSIWKISLGMAEVLESWMVGAGVLARCLAPSQVSVFINMVQAECGRKYVVLPVLNNRYFFLYQKDFLALLTLQNCVV